MANINLHQSFQKGEELRKKTSFFASRTFISLMIIIIFTGAYFGFLYYQSLLKNKKKSWEDRKGQELLSINRDDVRVLVDFNKKVEDIKYNLEKKNNPESNLSRLEELILDDVYLNSYGFDYGDSLVEIEGVTGNLQSVAEQMLNFKKSGYFADIEISSTKRDKEGQVVFGLSMKVIK